MRYRRIAAILLTSLFFALLPHRTQAADLHPFALPDGFTQDVLAKDLGPATAFAIRPDGSILIARKHGSVKVYRDGKILEGPFLDLSGETNNYGDRGLMGIAVHPNYPAVPYVYLAYVYEPPGAEAMQEDAESGARTARVIRVEADRRNPDQARPNSAVVILGANGTPEHAGNPVRGDRPPFACMAGDGSAAAAPMRDCLPVDGPSHTVDDLRFGPDGALYVSVGDGTLQPDLNVRAQNLDSLAGKVLRIDPITGRGLPDNPFYAGDPDSNRAKVYALGMRNPYRFTFDPAGELVVGDVGGERWEEINRGEPGANFGWPCLEGPLPNSGDPACAGILSGADPSVAAWHSYSHAGGYSAAIGGDFYTGEQYPPAYQGAYFFADHNRAALLYLPAGDPGDGEAQVFATNVVAPVQISMGPDGALYVLSFVDGSLSRIRYTGGTTAAPGAGAASTAQPPQEESGAAADTGNTGTGGRSTGDTTGGPTGGPAVRITAPAGGSRWPGGAEVPLRGEATGADGSALDGDVLQWTATLHHNDHVHPDFFHGTGAAETFRIEPHAPNSFYAVCLTATDSAGRTATDCIELYEDPAAVPAEPAGSAVADITTQGVGHEVWQDVGGATVASLTQHTGYPDRPDWRDLRPTFDVTGEGKDYGARLWGWLTPPADGLYRFWIAADDSGELWLSTDADPAHAALIAYTSGWTPRHAWERAPSQASAPIELKAGQRYYIEARHKQADQKDNLAVAWQPPGEERTLIDSVYLSPE